MEGMLKPVRSTGNSRAALDLSDSASPVGAILRCVRLCEELAEFSGPVAVNKLAAHLHLVPSTTRKILDQHRKNVVLSLIGETTTDRSGLGSIRNTALAKVNTPFQGANVRAPEAPNEPATETRLFASGPPPPRSDPGRRAPDPSLCLVVWGSRARLDIRQAGYAISSDRRVLGTHAMSARLS